MKYIAISQPGGPEVLQIREGEIPIIGEHEVLIEVKAAGVNRPDILQRQGLYPMPEGVTPVPGLEVAGVVVKVGAQVTAFTPGDRVCALTNGGGYAEYCAVPAGQTLPIPAGLSFSEAAAIPETFFTVWANVFQLGKLQSGESILIHGGGAHTAGRLYSEQLLQTLEIPLCGSWSEVGEALDEHSLAFIPLGAWAPQLQRMIERDRDALLVQAGLPKDLHWHVYLPALVLLSLLSSLTAPIGARLAHKLPVATLKKVFAGLLIALSAKMLHTVLGG